MEMQINQETSAPLTLDGNPIQQIDKFQYLGCMVSKDGGAAVEARIKKARGVFTTLNRTKISSIYGEPVKINIFRSCVISVLLYGWKTWLILEDI